MKLGISIITVFMLFLIGCGCGNDPNARSIKIEVAAVKDWPAGDKLCAVIYKDSSKMNRMKKDINVPGNVEFKVKCEGKEKIWIEFTDTKCLASLNLETLGESLTVYADGEKIAYGPLPERGKYTACFELDTKKK